MKRLKSKFLSIVLAMSMLVAIATPNQIGDVSATVTPLNYARQLQLSLYFFDANMCGGDVGTRNSDDGKRSALRWRGDCHTQDANISVPIAFGGGTIDLSGGYHDAGDHVKFNLPIGYAGATLGWAYYEFEEAFTELNIDGHARRILDHFAEYFRKCTIWDSSGTAVAAYAYQVGQGGDAEPNGDHGYWGPPELQTGNARGATRYARFTDATSQYPGTDQISVAAALLAANYVNFGNPEDLRHAKALYELARNGNKGLAQAGGTHTSPGDGFYVSQRWEDKMALAAEWLFLATNDTAYREQSNDLTTSGSDWPNSWAGMWPNVTAMRAARGQVQWSSVRNPYMNRVNTSSTSYLVVGDWGTARYNAALQMVGLIHDNYNTDQYASWADSQMRFLLGNNSIARTEGSTGNPTCFVFGCCSNSITRPHHRGATGFTGNNVWDRFNNNEAPLNVLTGTLAGGPTSSSGSLADRYNTYQTAEMACDYQAGFVGALAGLYLRNKSHQPIVPGPSTIPGYRPVAGTVDPCQDGHTPGAAATCGIPQTCVRCPHQFAPATGNHTRRETNCSQCSVCNATGLTRNCPLEEPCPTHSNFFHYDMQEDVLLPAWSGGSSANTHPFLTSRGGNRAVAGTPPDRTVTITGRGGTSQGIDIWLSGGPSPLITQPGFSYEFDVSVRAVTAHPSQTSHNFFIRPAVDGASNAPTDPEAVVTASAATNADANLNVVLTHEQIQSFIAAGMTVLRIGGADGPRIDGSSGTQGYDIRVSKLIVSEKPPAIGEWYITVNNADSGKSISTRGWFITDGGESDPDELFKWQLPARIIRPGSYIQIYGRNQNPSWRWKRGQADFDFSDTALRSRLKVINASGEEVP
ncbi:MAG: glycoside hydrolase family 9 protein [Oscillospiraceae bacterium]|nr:glycoside hydrolase family 9 protein [Oscillospiraceae bacterium]